MTFNNGIDYEPFDKACLREKPLDTQAIDMFDMLTSINLLLVF